ncbi:MAG TPA: DUF998 domain-containing protein [Anaerolineales bacterium]|nr:DUF998 domain-containing protein [Anaerolineales bacterium]
MKNSAHASNRTALVASRMAVIFSATFLIILFLLHFLKPELDPSWRMISEYEIGRYGWMMSLAFFCWGSSVLSLLVALWHSLRTIGGTIGYIWLLLIGIALFGAGIFVTNPITDTTVSTANTLHTLCGAFVILTFPIASSLVVGSLARNEEWSPARRLLLWVEVLVWLSMFAFFGSIIVSNAINPSAGRVGPEVYLGWPNRFMVLIYNVWLITIAVNARKLSSGL